MLVLYLSGPGPSAGRGSGNVDIGLIAFDRPDRIQPIVSSPAYDGYPAISPDGRLLAYESDESGRTEVYVRPLTGGARRQVSRSGGSNPVWAWSGRELFFYGEGVLHAAKIQTSGELTVGEVVPLFSVVSAQYMATPMPGDSQFVAFQAADETENKPAPIVVLVNLGEALRQLFASQKAKQ